MNSCDKEFLLRAYGEQFGPEAGPWNTSAHSKYLEYMLASFFEKHIAVKPGDHICNIGVGAGAWDRFLSYQLKGGSLTSIDIDEGCCRQLRLGLENENNPNTVRVICSDVLLLDGMDGQFDIVTMVGSTRLESGQYEGILQKAASFIKPGGVFYYQTLDQREKRAGFAMICESCSLKIEAYLLDTSYGMRAQFFAARKAG